MLSSRMPVFKKCFKERWPCTSSVCTGKTIGAGNGKFSTLRKKAVVKESHISPAYGRIKNMWTGEKQLALS